MTGMPTDVLGGVIGLVVVAMAIGVVDLVRQPGWAWKAAGEPKIVCLLLVVLLPGVGLAIYVFGARPKVVAVVAGGRAAALPFERFTDRADTAAEDATAIGVLSMPTTIGSFGQTVARPLRSTGSLPGTADIKPAVNLRPPVQPPAATATPHRSSFFDDPDVLPVGAAATFFERGAMTEHGVPDTAPAADVGGPAPVPEIRIPSGIGRSYNPRQRTSLEEEPLDGSGTPAATATRAAGGPTGPTATAGAIAPTLAAPRVGTSSPEIFRPRPQTVAPIAGSGMTATATLARIAPRWMNDPTGRHQYRYWDGENWTENVYDAGVESRDPVGT